MSGIRTTNTLPEIKIRSILHRLGFRFRIHVPALPGKPDIVLPKYRAVILIHGCFWHNHTCPLFKWPATRADFWRTKIERNRRNDQKAVCALKAQRWRVAIVWECALKGTARLDHESIGNLLRKWLKAETEELEISGDWN